MSRSQQLQPNNNNNTKNLAKNKLPSPKQTARKPKLKTTPWKSSMNSLNILMCVVHLECYLPIIFQLTPLLGTYNILDSLLFDTFLQHFIAWMSSLLMLFWSTWIHFPLAFQVRRHNSEWAAAWLFYSQSRLMCCICQNNQGSPACTSGKLFGKIAKKTKGGS